jgi:hypothetical protein
MPADFTFDLPSSPGCPARPCGIGNRCFLQLVDGSKTKSADGSGVIVGTITAVSQINLTLWRYTVTVADDQVVIMPAANEFQRYLSCIGAESDSLLKKTAVLQVNAPDLLARISRLEIDTRIQPPSICSTADVWFRNGGLAYAAAANITAWPNSGTLGTPITQATVGLQPIARADGIYSQPFAEFAGAKALQATVARSFPCTIYTVVKAGFPTTVPLSPWSCNNAGAFINQQSNSFSGAWYLSADLTKYIVIRNARYPGEDESVAPPTLRTAGHWMVVKAVCNGPNSVLSINGDPMATKGGDIGTSSPVTVRILGSYLVGSLYCNTNVKEHIEFPGVLSAADDAAVMAWLNNRYVRTSQLICDGSSITEGTLPDANSDWPSQILALLKGNWTVHNWGKGGQDLAGMSADAASQIDAKINPSALHKIVVAEAPTNSFFYISAGTLSGTAASIYADYKTYCLARRAAGYKVISTTIMPRAALTDPNPSLFESLRVAFNALVRAGALTFSDAFVDIAADPRFQNPADTVYFADKVHLTVLGLGIFAKHIALGISSLTDVSGGKGIGT